ncbi:hypothetical protein D3C87_2031540 [compost metagenome]
MARNVVYFPPATQMRPEGVVKISCSREMSDSLTPSPAGAIRGRQPPKVAITSSGVRCAPGQAAFAASST